MKTFKEYLREQGGPSLTSPVGPGDMGAPGTYHNPSGGAWTWSRGAGGPMPNVVDQVLEFPKYEELQNKYGPDPRPGARRRANLPPLPWWYRYVVTPWQ